MPSAIVMRSTLNGSDGSQLTQYFHTHFSLELCKVKYYCPHFTRSDICTTQIALQGHAGPPLTLSLPTRTHLCVSSGANGKYRGSQLLERSLPPKVTASPHLHCSAVCFHILPSFWISHQRTGDASSEMQSGWCTWVSYGRRKQTLGDPRG